MSEPGPLGPASPNDTAGRDALRPRPVARTAGVIENPRSPLAEQDKPTRRRFRSPSRWSEQALSAERSAIAEAGRRATRVVAAQSIDVDDCRELLSMLGLSDVAGLAVTTPPRRVDGHGVDGQGADRQGADGQGVDGQGADGRGVDIARPTP